MRIDPKTVTSITSYKAREQAPTAAKASTETSKSSVVQLSTAAGAAAATATSTHKATATRVETIRAAIAKGDYPIDLDKLASSIVDDEHNPRGGSA